MVKVVINSCYGGFSLSHDAEMEFARRKGITLYPFVNARKADGGIDFYNMVPFTGHDAFMIHYYTAPEPSDENYYETGRKAKRDDPDLIALVSEWGERAHGRYAKLEIVEIPDDVKWEVVEYDGNEWVAEQHRRWP